MKKEITNEDQSVDSLVVEYAKRNAKKEIASMFAECRKSQGITQNELAKMTGVSRTNITRFENGTYNPSVDMMVKIAMALGMKLDIKLKK